MTERERGRRKHVDTWKCNSKIPYKYIFIHILQIYLNKNVVGNPVDPEGIVADNSNARADFDRILPRSVL